MTNNKAKAIALNIAIILCVINVMVLLGSYVALICGSLVPLALITTVPMVLGVTTIITLVFSN